MSAVSTPSPNTQTATTIRLALVMGVVVFGAVAMFVIKPEPPELSLTGPLAPLTTFAFGMAILSYAGRMLLLWMMRSGVTKEKLESTPEEAQSSLFFASWQTRTLIEGAIWEGAAFLAVIAFIKEGYPITLLFAGALVASMLATLPTRGSFERFVYEESQRISRQ